MYVEVQAEARAARGQRERPFFDPYSCGLGSHQKDFDDSEIELFFPLSLSFSTPIPMVRADARDGWGRKLLVVRPCGCVPSCLVRTRSICMLLVSPSVCGRRKRSLSNMVGGRTIHAT